VVLDELAQAHVLVSASRSESFGLAVSDARASRCVVLARAAGHVAQLVSAAAGGALLADDGELVQALLALCRDPAALRERLERAALHALPTRSWHEAAADLLSQLALLAWA
jgi:glycosyltransferase involved in cell wall biosynthesis